MEHNMLQMVDKYFLEIAEAIADKEGDKRGYDALVKRIQMLEGLNDTIRANLLANKLITYAKNNYLK